MLKGTFQVAAVTVEVFGVAIKAAVAPLRAMIGAVSEIHSAIASALGITGVNVAFELEKAYQQVLGVFLDISNFVVGLGVQLGKFIGAQVTKALNASKDIRNGILGAFGGVFEKVAGFIRNAYNLIPEPIRKFIEGKLSGAQAFIDETVALGKGAIGGALTPDQTQQFKPQNNIISTNKDLVTSPTGKTDQEKADELAKIAEAHADRVKKMEQQTLLASALNAEETKNFQRQIAISDLLQNKNNLSDTQLKKELDILTNLHEQEDATAEIIKNKDAQTKQLEEQAAAAESLKEKYKQVGDAIKSKVTDSIIAAIDGTKSLGESAMGILKDLANQFLRSGISQLFGAVGGMGPSGGFLSMLFGGGKASGGTVKGGTSYMVGERGPELFTPGRSGSIAPNSAMGGANVTVNVDASGSKVQGNQADGKALGSAIGAAVQAELIKQKRPGGLLAG